MFDFKLILILILSIVIYILYNKIDKISAEVDKIKITLTKEKKTDKEVNKEETKQKYLEHFYDNNSESAVNNISNIDETTEIIDVHHQNNINNETIKKCFDHNPENDDISESSISIDFNLSEQDDNNAAHVVDKKNNDIYDENMDINIDNILNDQQQVKASGYFQSIANTKPSDDLLEPLDYDLEENKIETNNEIKDDKYNLQEIIIEDGNEVEDNNQIDDNNEIEIVEDKNMIDSDSDSDSESEQSYEQQSSINEPLLVIDEPLLVIDDDMLASVKADKNSIENDEDKNEKDDLMENLREIMLNSSFNKHKLDKLQNYAKELNINIEKDINGKIKNKTKSELWKEISQNINK